MNICIVHYNTPKLTEALVKSINKYVGTNCNIYIFDNSDKYPFVYKQNNIKIFDNTKGQIINFDNELKKYPNRGGEASRKFISFKHCISVDKCFDLIDNNFILLDSDVLLKKDISNFEDDSKIFVGEIGDQSFSANKRILPYCCFINVNMCKKYGVRFFDSELMHGLHKNSNKKNSYDTGAAFLLKIYDYDFEEIKIDDYIEHYKGASWGIDLYSNRKIHGNMSPAVWLNVHRKYWDPKMNVKLYGMTLVYNESKMIPYIMPYYERLGFDKLVIYDNESTDNTVELLKKYSFVEVRTFSTGGKKNNRIQSELKSNFYKEFKNCENTWLYIADFDEVIYYNGNFKTYLQGKNDEGYTCLNQNMFELIVDKFPEKDKLIHEYCRGCFWGDTNGGYKTTLIKADGLISMKYGAGAHWCEVKTNIKFKSLNNLEIKSFHIKYIDYDYCFERTQKAANHRSIEDIKNKYGEQYLKLENEETFKNNWENIKKKSVSVNDYLNGRVESNQKTALTKCHWTCVSQHSDVGYYYSYMYGGYNK